MNNYIDEFILQAINEDVGNGDYTSLACIPNIQKSTAKLIVKQPGVLSGVDIALKVFKAVDANLEVEVFIKDSNKINVGDIVLTVSGSAQSILTSERLALNFMQRMSGIATVTNKIQSLINHTAAKLLDTRKTTPSFRVFEKLAVIHGGGLNHRFGLFDMLMIKDNHIDYAGGIKNAVDAAYTYLEKNNLNLKIEVETRNLKEVEQVLQGKKVHRIMLDNFTPALLKEAVILIANQTETEASGGITIDNIIPYAETGVDFISMGALTHSYHSLDLSLKAI